LAAGGKPQDTPCPFDFAQDKQQGISNFQVNGEWRAAAAAATVDIDDSEILHSCQPAHRVSFVSAAKWPIAPRATGKNKSVAWRNILENVIWAVQL